MAFKLSDYKNRVRVGTKGRLPWIDWMKTIGMVFIVYGHMFSLGEQFVYAFNVPLFFVISGFLSKINPNNNDFWQALWTRLVFPMIIISTINNVLQIAIDLAQNQFNGQSLLFPLGILIGDQSCLKACWFIYSLLVIRILNQYVNLKYQAIICAIGMVVAICVRKYCAFVPHNAILSSLLAYPFFLIGRLFKEYGLPERRVSVCFSVFAVVALSILLVVDVSYNGDVRVYKFDYGHSLLLYLIGGTIGSIIVYLCCHCLNAWEGAEVISKGSIVLLGFHQWFVSAWLALVPTYRSLLDLCVAVIIVLVFIPIIRFSPPILLGYRV